MRNFLIIVFLLFSRLGFSQQISLQAGQSFSEIRFEDSNGVELQNLRTVNHFFMMAEYRNAIFPDQFDGKLLGNIGLRFSGYGSTGSDPALNNFFEWDLSYLGLVFGVDYEFYEIGRFTGFLGAKVSPEVLVRGSQTLNNEVFDLVGEDDFDTPIFFFRGAVGTKFQLTDDASLFAQYTYGQSYSFFDSGSDQLNIIAQSFGIGLFADITSGGAPKRKRRR